MPTCRLSASEPREKYLYRAYFPRINMLEGLAKLLKERYPPPGVGGSQLRIADLSLHHRKFSGLKALGPWYFAKSEKSFRTWCTIATMLPWHVPTHFWCRNIWDHSQTGFRCCQMLPTCCQLVANFVAKLATKLATSWQQSWQQLVRDFTGFSCRIVSASSKSHEKYNVRGWRQVTYYFRLSVIL